MTAVVWCTPRHRSTRRNYKIGILDDAKAPQVLISSHPFAMIPSIFFLLTMATFQVISCWLTVHTRGRGRKLPRHVQEETLQTISQGKAEASW